MITCQGLVSCGNKKAYQAQLDEAQAKTRELEVQQRAIEKEIEKAKENVAERMTVLKQARYPKSVNKSTASVDDLEEISQYFQSQSAKLAKEEEVLRSEVESIRKEMEEYKAAYLSKEAPVK